MQTPLSYDQVVNLFTSHHYPFNPNEITLFGKRSNDLTSDLWNDQLGILHEGKIVSFTGTTDPGKSPLLKTDDVNKDGIFILAPGFYKNCWHKGLHKGKYRALVQFGSGIFKGWRDNNHDGKIDLTGPIWTNVQGLNFHTTRWDKKVMRVGDFSEGCQVTEVAQEFDKYIEVIYGSTQPLFSYALFQD